MTEIELAIPPGIDRRPGIDQCLGATRIRVGVVRCTAGELVQPDRYGPSVLELRSDRSRREATIRDLRDDEVPLDLLTIRTLNVSALMAVLDRDRLRAARRRCRRWGRGRCLRRLRHGFTRSEREHQARDQEREAQKGRDPRLSCFVASHSGSSVDSSLIPLSQEYIDTWYRLLPASSRFPENTHPAGITRPGAPLARRYPLAPITQAALLRLRDLDPSDVSGDHSSPKAS